MRIPCSDLDCPNWVLPEISTLAKIVKWKLSLSLWLGQGSFTPQLATT
uniref:Uncharacterized protein n=1 Tax=Gopherus agassizii TaxID=38772 RepID=A0A452GHY1_9SAUR